MELEPETINSFLQGVPRARRAAISADDHDPVERYFDLAAYYGDPSDDNQSRSESSSFVLTPGLITDSATSPSVISDSSGADIVIASSNRSRNTPPVAARGDLPPSRAGAAPRRRHHHHDHHQQQQQPQHAAYQGHEKEYRSSSNSSSNKHHRHQSQSQHQHQRHHHREQEPRQYHEYHEYHQYHQSAVPDHHSTRKALHEVRMQDPQIIWPRADPDQRLPRSAVLHLPSSRKKSRRPSSPASRHVRNPAETAQVRKVGACIKCRIEKLKCSDGGICSSCNSKFGDPLCQRTCLRKTLTDTARHTTPVRYTGLRYDEEQAVLRTRCSLDRGLVEVSLSFGDTDPLAPTLETVFQLCRSQEDGTEVLMFPRDRVPPYEQLVGWVEDQILFERHTGLSGGFESSVEAFIMSYTRAGTGLPQLGLLEKIHQMKCMYRIWKMDTIYLRQHSTGRMQPLPPFAQAELRQIVRRALESFERDILGELDKFLKPSGIPTKDRAPMWAGLWQLIFMFQDLTRFFFDAEAQSAHLGMLLDAHHDFELCSTATEQLYVAILSFYGSHYRQASNLQANLHCIDSGHIPSSQMRRSVEDAFQRARLDRGSFHHAIQHSSDVLDGLMKTLVVDHEVKRLSRRRGRGGVQAQVMAVAPVPGMYESDDEGDIDMLHY